MTQWRPELPHRCSSRRGGVRGRLRQPGIAPPARPTTEESRDESKLPLAFLQGDAYTLPPHLQVSDGQPERLAYPSADYLASPSRYDPGTDQYDSSPKRRIPAWCDRILYRTDRGEHVHPLHYQRYEVNISDHKPVSAAFELQIKRIDSAKRAAVWQEVESAWFSVESSVLEAARKYYSDHAA